MNSSLSPSIDKTNERRLTGYYITADAHLDNFYLKKTENKRLPQAKV